MDGPDVSETSMNDSAPDITVVIPNWNGLRWLPDCLATLSTQTWRAFRVIVVDNGSSDGSIDWLRREHPSVHIIAHATNTGFAHAVNTGIRAADTPFIALLNNDTRLRPDWLEKLRAALLAAGDRAAGVCGKMLLMNDPSRIENAGDRFSWQGAAEKRGRGAPATEFATPGEVFSCCAGGALYRARFFKEAGLFDESFFAYLEDIDLGLRGRLLGWTFHYEPSAQLEHHSHGSGLPSPRYVRLTTANRLALFIKNIPTGSLLRHASSILYGQWYFLVCNRRPLSSFAGYADVVRRLPSLLRDRRRVRAATRLDARAIDTLLAPRMALPGLFAALRNKWRGGRP